MADASARKLAEAEKGTVQKSTPLQGDGASGSQTSPNTDAPPSYDSMFGKIKSTVTKQKSNAILKSKVFSVIFVTVVFLILICNIVMGSLFLYKCPVNTFIPIFLILTGSLTILFVLCIYGDSKDKEPELFSCIRQMLVSLLPFGLFGLFVAGNVSVFNTDWVDSESSPKYCHPGLYLYTRWVMVSPWMFFGLLVLSVIVQSMYNVCKGVCKKDQSTDAA